MNNLDLQAVCVIPSDENNLYHKMKRDDRMNIIKRISKHFEIIYSKLEYNDLRDLSAKNSMAEIFELIGIYKEYNEDLQNNSFVDFYKTKRATTLFHYRNIGERIIKALIKSENIFIPRFYFRSISQTWKKTPVISAVEMGLIFTETIEYLYSNTVLWEILTSEILKECDSSSRAITDNLVNHCIYRLLDFQYVFVTRSLNVDSLPKRKYAREIITKWESCTLILEISKTCEAHLNAR